MPRIEYTISADSSEFQKKIEALIKDAEKFDKSMSHTAKEAESAFSDIRESVEGLHKSFERISEFFLTGLGIEKFTELGLGAAEVGERIESASQVTGLSTERIQELTFAASQAGVSTETFGQSIVKLSRSMIEAQQGSAKAVNAFAAFGLKASDLKNMKVDEVLSRVAEKFASTQDGATKDAVAFELFGRSAAEMVPFLDKGAGYLAEMAEEATKLGIVMSGQQVQALSAANEKFRELGAVLGMTKTQIGAELVPAFLQIAKAMEDGLAAGAPLRELFSGLDEVLRFAARAGLEVAFTLDTLGKDIAAAAQMANRAVHADIAGIRAVHAEIVAEEQEINTSFNKLRADLSEPLAMPKVENPNSEAPKGQLHLGNIEASSQALKDQFAAQNAEYKAEQALLAEDIKEKQKALEESYKAGVISLQSYYSQRQALSNSSMNQEVEAIKRQISQTQALQAQASGTKQSGEIEVKLIELNGQLALAEKKRIDAALDGNREFNDALKLQTEQIGQIQLKATEDAAKARIDAEQKELDALKSMNLISDARYIAAETNLQNQLYAIDLAALQKQRALFNNKPVEQAQIDAQIEKLETAHQAKITEIQLQAQQQQMQMAKEVYESISNDFDQTVAKFLQGGEKMGTAWQKFAQLFDQTVDQMFAKLLTQSIFGGGGSGPGLLGGVFGGGGTGGGTGGGSTLGLWGSFLKDTPGLASLLGSSSGTATSAAAATDASLGMNSSALTSAFSFAPIDVAGGLALGGYAEPSTMYEVAENGPETLSVGGRTFLMMGRQGGQVTPSIPGSGAGHTFNTTNNFHMNSPMDSRSQSQIAAAATAAGTRAARRM